MSEALAGCNRIGHACQSLPLSCRAYESLFGPQEPPSPVVVAAPVPRPDVVSAR